MSAHHRFLGIGLSNFIVIIEFTNLLQNNLVSTSLFGCLTFLEFQILIWILHLLVIFRVNSTFHLLWSAHHFAQILSGGSTNLRVHGASMCLIQIVISLAILSSLWRLSLAAHRLPWGNEGLGSGRFLLFDVGSAVIVAVTSPVSVDLW